MFCDVVKYCRLGEEEKVIFKFLSFSTETSFGLNSIIRQELANKVFNSLDELEEGLVKILQQFYEDRERVKSLTRLYHHPRHSPSPPP